MQLNFLNIEDIEGQCLRIRLSDLRANGFVRFKLNPYDPLIELTEEEEKQAWVFAASKVKEIYGHMDTVEMEPYIRNEFSAGIVAIEFDHESGELTLKENKKCQSSTKVNTSTQQVSLKPKISKKAKPNASSKNLKKSRPR